MSQWVLELHRFLCFTEKDLTPSPYQKAERTVLKLVGTSLWFKKEKGTYSSCGLDFLTFNQNRNPSIWDVLFYWGCTRYCTVQYKVKPPQLCHSSSLGSVLSMLLTMPPWRKLCCRTGCSQACVKGHQCRDILENESSLVHGSSKISLQRSG